jgi:hypothetical protein
MIVVLCFAAMLYLLMLADLWDTPGTDAAGRGLNQAFAALVGLVLWILLGVLLVMAAARGRMPAVATLAAVVLLPLSAWAAAEAAGLYNRQNVWPYAVPVVLPPLIAAYAVWARFPRLHGVLKPLPTSLVIGLAITGLSILPIAVKAYESRPDPERDARLAAEYKARQEAEERRFREEKEQEAAAFAKLGPDSSLMDYLRFTDTSVRDQAYRDMKKVKSRQADIVVLLQKKGLDGSPSLMLLDLQPTAEVCQAYRGALASAATRISPKLRSDYGIAAMQLEYEVSTIEWLSAHDCNLDEALTLAATNIRATSDSDRLTRFAAKLEGMRQAK